MQIPYTTVLIIYHVKPGELANNSSEQIATF